MIELEQVLPEPARALVQAPDPPGRRSTADHRCPASCYGDR